MRPRVSEPLLLAGLVAWCTLLAGIDALLVQDVVLLTLLVTGPLVAAALASPRTVSILGPYAILLAVLLGFANDMFASADHLVRVLVVTLAAALALWLSVIRERLERARFRYSLIADAGVVLGSALDHEVTLIELARLCVRRMSDWCFVFLAQDDGSIRQVAAAHVNPERQREAWELLFRYPLDPRGEEGPAAVIRSGRSQLLPQVPDALLAAISADEENLRLLRALRIRSAMLVPLSARGRTLGAIAFASSETGRVYGTQDLELAEELGARAAIAVDNARLYGRLSAAEGELRASRDELQAILAGVADAVTAQAPDGRIVYANEAAARQVGLSSSEEMMRTPPAAYATRYRLFDEDGNEFPFDDLPGRRALRGEDPEPTLVRYRNAETGEDRWSLIKAKGVRDESGNVVIAINVVEDVTEQREREEQQRFLSESSKVLAGSLDWEQTFPEVARLVARELAEWCAIEVLDDRDEVQVAAFAHKDPHKQRRGEELIRENPPSAAEGRGLRDALASGRSELSPEFMAVPMIARGRVVGAISFVSGEGSRRFTEDDLLLAEELAGRCGLALDNARLFRERSRIARTLQESLLPPILPDLPGIDVAARFRAAGAGIEVGGDFYDLFETGASDWAVAIGDVCGKGTEAAAITALARYTVRAAAMRQDDPSQILALLNEALLRQRTDKRFCTVLYGRLSRNGSGDAAFEFASGGHPLPLLLRAASSGAEVGEPGTLLGIVPDPDLRDERVHLSPGDAVVLYTDGVTDSAAPRRVLTGEQLVAHVGPVAGVDADSIAERMMDAAMQSGGPEPRDDIAILVLKVPDR